MKQVLLINPYIYDFAAYDFWVKPMGLLYLSSILKNQGINTVLIDCMDRSGYYQKKEFATKENNSGKFYKVEIEKPEPVKFMPRKFYRYGIPVETFLTELSRIYPKPDAICVTCLMSYWYYGANETIKFVKQIFPEVPVIFGGTYNTLWNAHSKKIINADYFISGAGEIKLIELLNDILCLNIEMDKNLENTIKFNVPDYSLYHKLISGAVMTSRGCRFNCNYCASKKIFNGHIKFPVEAAVDTIDYLVNERGVFDIAFYDDALLEDSDNHFVPIMQEILRRNIKCRFHLPNAVHIKYVTEKIALLMKQAGFDTIRIGFESSDINWIKGSGAKYSNSDFENCIKSFENAGIDFSKIAAYILTGLPGQTLENIKETVSFVNQYSINCDYAFYSPMPHTVYWEKSVEMFPQILNEPLLTNSSVFPVLSGLFFDRRQKKNRQFIH
ncbi:radical SAM protein [Candidatus Dependentiae bacterium]|nr:radical SAM protein [Candidatus Dependentiae bacterium]